VTSVSADVSRAASLIVFCCLTALSLLLMCWSSACPMNTDDTGSSVPQNLEGNTDNTSTKTTISSDELK